MLTALQLLAVAANLAYFYYRYLTSTPAVTHSADASSIYKILHFIYRFLLYCSTILCLLLWAHSRVALMDSFSLLPSPSGKLVTSGLYARIGHPIYLFSTLAATQFLLLIERVDLLPWATLLAVVQWLRAKREERGLLAAFGEEYKYHREQLLC